MSARPLAGIKVVELGQVLAGPFAGMILADLGATVIKVEKPDGGDDARRMGPAFRDGDALIFKDFNRGKRSLVLDLKTPEGIAALHRELEDADILLHNLRPGAAEALGLGPEAVMARHPRLIYCAMGAFGHRGPLSTRPGYEPLLQAYCGLSSITGDPAGPPVRMGASVVDQGTGMWTVIGALAALLERQRTGRGMLVNTSLFETATTWAGPKLLGWINRGEVPVRHASGHPDFVPYQAFDAADGPILICCGNDRLFRALATLLGEASWADDPRFATNRARLAHREELLPLIARHIAARPRAEWLAALEAAGVPCAPIHSIQELAEDAQFHAMGQLQPVPGADYRLLGLPISFDGERPPITAPAPALGEYRPEE
ncbi:MAG: CoA transferase [Rhodovarius sp.]|nr:CoA transferase [Rhodovarius sp.]